MFKLKASLVQTKDGGSQLEKSSNIYTSSYSKMQLTVFTQRFYAVNPRLDNFHTSGSRSCQSGRPGGVRAVKSVAVLASES